MNILHTFNMLIERCRELQRVLAILLASIVVAGCASQGVSSAYFDATEVGGAYPTSPSAINTYVYTKIVGVPFSLDILAGAIMDAAHGGGIQDNVSGTYPTGDSNVDLVDWNASGGSCGSVGDARQVSGVTIGSPTTTAYGGSNSSYYKWTGAERGRKTYTSITVSKPVANARVRIYGMGCSPVFPFSCTTSTQCSRDSFSVRPASLVVASTPTSASTQAAGVNYTMTATAVNAAGTTITTYTGTPVLTTTGITDWNSQTVQSGAFTGTFGAAVAGVSSGSFSYGDFGQLSIPAGAVKDSNYVTTGGSGDVASNDCVANSSSNTANGSGLYGCNIGNQAAVSTPRFIPHHYAVTHAITPACNNKFTYFGQPFNFTMSVEALNASGGRLTRLTSGAPNKPTMSITQLNSGSATINPVTIPAANLVWSDNSTFGTSSGGAYFTSTTTSAPYSAGAIAVTTTRPAGLSYASAAPPSYESFVLRTTSSDANITLCNGVVVGSSTTCDSPVTALRYGVLKLNDGVSTPLSPATIQISARYWNGSAFVTNTDDTCTTIQFNTGTIASSGTPKPVAKNASTTLSNGVGALMLSATLSSNLAIRLGGSDNNCVAATSGTVTSPNALSSYLGALSCSASYDKDPSSGLTFGTLRSTYIYRAEKF